MPGGYLWGWDGTGWVKVQVDEDGYVLVDMSEINLDDLNDVNVTAPTDGDFIEWDSTTSKWIKIAHKDATTGAHGVGAGTIGSVSTANKTIYVDKAATGAGDGTSWTDAFTTIQDAVDSLDDIILHAYTIIVRKGATPYREQVELNSLPASFPSHLILGSLTIEGEYYWQGNCEANVGGAGEITDTAAFADVLVGDKVFVLDLNGANGRVQDHELCTVDDIANIPNRIGTDGVKTPTTLWRYVIVRTEISGSDDGTDGGTVRNHCFRGNTIDKTNIFGFYLTFSDHYVIDLTNCRRWIVYYIIAEACDSGINAYNLSSLYARYIYMGDNPTYGLVSQQLSNVIAGFNAFPNTTTACAFVGYTSYLWLDYSYMAAGARGMYAHQLGMGYLYLSTISNAVNIGVKASYNSSVQVLVTTNNAPTPEQPVGTVEGAYIG